MTKIRLLASAAAFSLLALPGYAQQMQDMKNMPMGGQSSSKSMAAPVAKEVQATGTVRSIDPAKRIVNLSHGPIQAIGWPAMTMDFAVDSKVDLSAVKAGQAVEFTLRPAGGDAYIVTRIKPNSKTKG